MTSATPSRRRVFAVRVDIDTPAAVEEIAAQHGCYRVAPHTRELVGAAGVMLDRIADGRLLVVPAPADDE
jgi:hypothetical protein